MTRTRRTLLWQLGAALVTLQLILLAALAWYTVGRLNTFHEGQRIDELDRITALLVEDHAAGMLQEDPRDLDRLVKSLGHAAAVRITVILADGRVIADSGHDPETMDDHSGRPEILAASVNGTGSAVRHSRTLGLDMMYFARRLDDSGGGEAYIRTSLPLIEARSPLAALLRALGTAAILSLGLICLLVVAISRRLSTTVSRLADGADRFAAGDLTHRVTPPESHELARLAEALNEMAEQLDHRIADLRRRDLEQQAILQSMGNGVIALDRDERVLNINRTAERLLGVTAAESRGRLIGELIRQPELNTFVARALSEGSHEPTEFPLPGDPPVMVQAVSEALTDGHGGTTGVLVLLTDVTELRRLESVRSDFAANVSHELRTPITNIKGYIETLIDDGTDDREQTARFLAVVRKNSDRLAAIVEDVLALTRLEHPFAAENLPREPTPLATLIDGVVAEHESAARAKRITVRTNVETLTPHLHTALIEQALGNLVSNAIRYSPEDTTVTISAALRPPDEFAITVADEGPGIAEEHLPRLFERFYRVDKARSRALGGTGLGLAIVKHIALVHGGRVEVQSAVGRGSVFRLVIPDGAGTA